MKKLTKFFAVVILIIGCSLTTKAQNPVKVGYIDSILTASMPELIP